MPRKSLSAILNIVALENCRTGVTESLRRSKGGNMAAILKEILVQRLSSDFSGNSADVGGIELCI